MSVGSSNRAVGTVVLVNDRVRITRWHFSARGYSTGWHRHEFDYVVVPLFDGNLEVRDGKGVHIVELCHGEPYFRFRGVEHEVISANDFPCEFLEIELL
jgi:hypothetical protein